MEKIDNLDRKILEIIMKNARMPSKDVAVECGVSRAAIHQRIQRIAAVGDVYYVCIGKIEQLFADLGNHSAVCVGYCVVPLEKVAVDMPAVEINVVRRAEKCKFAFYFADDPVAVIKRKSRHKCKQFLLYRGYVIAVCIEYVQLVSPAHFALDCENGCARFIIYIVAVKP